MLTDGHKIRLAEAEAKMQEYSEVAKAELDAVKEKFKASALPHQRMMLTILFGATLPEMFEHRLGKGVLDAMGLALTITGLDKKPLGEMFTAEERAKFMAEGTSVTDILNIIMREDRISKVTPTTKPETKPEPGEPTRTELDKGFILAFETEADMMAWLAKNNIKT